MARQEIAPQAADWTLVVEPRHRWWDLRLAELWRARDLIALFVRRDFVAVYSQTILGPLWFLLQPLLTTITFTFVFGRIANLPTDGVPAFLFYMSGTVIWSYFAACLTKAAGTFTLNAALFGKVYFPRLAVPIASLISNLIAFGIQLGLFLVFLLYYVLAGRVPMPGGQLLLLPFLVVIMAGLGLGSGMIVAALTTRYRDLQHLVVFAVQLLMYATPVIYPVSTIPQRFRPFIQANPLTAVVEAFRFAFLGTGTASPRGLSYSFTFMMAVLITGVLLSNRAERTVMDVV